LARLGVKFDPEMPLNEVLQLLAGDCPHWTYRARWPEGCGAFFPDLEPSDLPPSPLRVIRGARKK
jgi:hypothetical protein